ncbi:MAG TPA: hypothetical protein VFS43_23925 [Polyangiaceae bacterium]|nr:hypothetical protein [Polyangiaceae bacterium]
MAGPFAVRLRRGGEAEAVAFDRDDVALRSTVAAAPGTPLEGALEVPGGEPLAIIVKVRRCRREPEGTFRIEGRLVNPTRALREALGGGPTPPAPLPGEGAREGAGPSPAPPPPGGGGAGGVRHEEGGR